MTNYCKSVDQFSIVDYQPISEYVGGIKAIDHVIAESNKINP